MVPPAGYQIVSELTVATSFAVHDSAIRSLQSEHYLCPREAYQWWVALLDPGSLWTLWVRGTIVGGARLTFDYAMTS